MKKTTKKHMYKYSYTETKQSQGNIARELQIS